MGYRADLHKDAGIFFINFFLAKWLFTFLSWLALWVKQATFFKF